VIAAATVDAHVSTHDQDGPISAPMVAALEAAWAAIRVRHPELPAVVLLLGAGSIGSPVGSLRLGHFAAMRWHTGDGQDGERLPEVFVGGEGLKRGPVNVLGTLLHEAAHALAHIRGIKDTSRQGRWHNARFKALAEELGIEVTKDSRIGCPRPPSPRGPRAVRRRDRRARRRAAAAPHQRGHRRTRQDQEARTAGVRVRVRAPYPRGQVRPRRRPDPVRRMRHRVHPDEGDTDEPGEDA
jgi:hypothetical protein